MQLVLYLGAYLLSIAVCLPLTEKKFIKDIQEGDMYHIVNPRGLAYVISIIPGINLCFIVTIVCKNIISTMAIRIVTSKLDKISKKHKDVPEITEEYSKIIHIINQL